MNRSVHTINLDIYFRINVVFVYVIFAMISLSIGFGLQQGPLTSRLVMI